MGADTQPGLAQLLMARGQLDEAGVTIRRVAAEAQDRVTRSRLLAAFVEIMLAAGDVPAARGAAVELAQFAVDVDAALLRAVAAHANGAVLLAEGDPRAALDALRQAWLGWHELDAPYEAARVRVLVGLACRALCDEATARMELDAARWVFVQLGAAPDVARVDRHSCPAPGTGAGGLTARELQVLRLVAAGRSNRAIAADLVISEHTVARHVQNILTKLDVGSRTSAAAYAFEHDLV